MSRIRVRPGGGVGVVVPAEATGGAVAFVEQVMARGTSFRVTCTNAPLRYSLA